MARRPALPGVDRRQQILDAALELFAEQGFEGATTTAIAARAGVTSGLLYFYFPGKEDLLAAAVESQMEHALKQLDITDEDTGDEPPEIVLRRIVTRFVDTMCSPQSVSLMRIMMRSAIRVGPDGRGEQKAAQKQEHMGVRPAVQAHMRTIVKALETYFQGETARGRLRVVNASLTAQLFMSSIVMTMIRRTTEDDDFATSSLSREELVETIVNLFLYGLVPQCDPVSETALPA